jgi:hypothetical protein
LHAGLRGLGWAKEGLEKDGQGAALQSAADVGLDGEVR